MVSETKGPSLLRMVCMPESLGSWWAVCMVCRGLGTGQSLVQEGRYGCDGWVVKHQRSWQRHTHRLTNLIAKLHSTCQESQYSLRDASSFLAS